MSGLFSNISLAVLAFIIAIFMPVIQEFTNIQMYYLSVAILVSSIIMLESSRRFLETRFSLFLGKISFPLYLVHIPVFDLFTIPLWRLTGSVLLTLISDVAIAIAIARFMVVPINEYSISLSRGLGRYCHQFALYFFPHVNNRVVKVVAGISYNWHKYQPKVSRLAWFRMVLMLAILLGMSIFILAISEPVKVVSLVASSQIKEKGGKILINALKKGEVMPPILYGKMNLDPDEAPLKLFVNQMPAHHYIGKNLKNLCEGCYWYDKIKNIVYYFPKGSDSKNQILNKYELSYPFLKHL